MLRKTQNEVLNESPLSPSHRTQKQNMTARAVHVTDGEMAQTRGTRETRTRLRFTAPPIKKKKALSNPGSVVLTPISAYTLTQS